MEARYIGGPLDGVRRRLPDGEAAVEVVSVPHPVTYNAGHGFYRSAAVRDKAEPQEEVIDLVWVSTGGQPRTGPRPHGG